MNNFALIQLCSVGLLATLCFLTPSVVSYLLLLLLFLRVFIFIRPTKGEKIQDFENPQKALIVIDVQESMCGNNGMYSEKEEFVNKINKVIAEAQKQNQKVIYICQEFHRYDCIFCFLAFGGRLLQGTKNASLSSGLKIVSDAVFIKHEQDAFTSKKLAEYLKENRINTISIVGLDASACVYKTAAGARNRGYSVSVVEEGIIGRSADRKKRALKKLSENGVKVIS